MSTSIYFPLTDSSNNLLTGSRVQIRPYSAPYITGSVSGSSGTYGGPVTAFTDASGVAHFPNVIPGLYKVSYTNANFNNPTVYQNFDNTIFYVNVLETSGSTVNGFNYYTTNVANTGLSASLAFTQVAALSLFCLQVPGSSSTAPFAISASWAPGGGGGSSVSASYLSGSVSTVISSSVDYFQVRNTTKDSLTISTNQATHDPLISTGDSNAGWYIGDSNGPGTLALVGDPGNGGNVIFHAQLSVSPNNSGVIFNEDIGQIIYDNGGFYGPFTGSLNGIASNAVSSSFATKTISSSFAVSASWAPSIASNFAISASWASASLSSSFATKANSTVSASWASQSINSNYLIGTATTLRSGSVNLPILIASPIGGNNPFVDMNLVTSSYEGQLAIAYNGTHQPFLFSAAKTGATGSSWNKAFNFSPGISQVGNQPGTGFDMDDIHSSVWALNGSPAGQALSGDSCFIVRNYSTNSLNSGAGLSVAVHDATGSVYSDVACAFNHVPSNRNKGLIPGNAMLVFNNDAVNLKGLYVASPAMAGFDTGNYSLAVFDFRNKLFRIPRWATSSFQPTDLGWADTLTADPVTGKVVISQSLVVGQLFVSGSITNLSQRGRNNFLPKWYNNNFTTASSIVDNGADGIGINATGSQIDAVLTVQNPFTTQSLWTPQYMTVNKTVWLRGDDVSGSVSSSVSLWRDTGSYGNNFTQSNSSIQPFLITSSLNGHNVVHFESGSLARMSAATQSANIFHQNLSFFAVANPYIFDNSGSATRGGLLGCGRAGLSNDFTFGPYKSSGGALLWDLYAEDSSTSVVIDDGVAVSASYYLVHGEMNNTSSFIEVYLNGAITASAMFTGSTLMDLDNLNLGWTPLFTHPFIGDLAEVLVTSQSLSVAEQQKTIGYLAWKYGLALPATHSYAGGAPLYPSVLNIQSWKDTSSNTLAYISSSGQFIGTASYAVSASWSPSSGGGTTLITASTYQITASAAINAKTASFVSGSNVYTNNLVVSGLFSSDNGHVFTDGAGDFEVVTLYVSGATDLDNNNIRTDGNGGMTAVSFTGSLLGNATSAVSSSWASASLSASYGLVTQSIANQNHYVSFAVSQSGYHRKLTDSQLTYNPVTSILTVPNITASLFGTSSISRNSNSSSYISGSRGVITNLTASNLMGGNNGGIIIGSGTFSSPQDIVIIGATDNTGDSAGANVRIMGGSADGAGVVYIDGGNNRIPGDNLGMVLINTQVTSSLLGVGLFNPKNSLDVKGNISCSVITASNVGYAMTFNWPSVTTLTSGSNYWFANQSTTVQSQVNNTRYAFPIPQNSTLRTVWLNTNNNTLDTQANFCTMSYRINSNELSSSFTFSLNTTVQTVIANPNITCSAGDQFLFHLKTPVTWSVQPTNTFFNGTMWFSIP